MTFLATAELCDAYPSLLSKGKLRVLPPIFQMYGPCRAFSGPIIPLKVFEDNVLVGEILENPENPGGGRVLVVDGGGSTRCALVGGNRGLLAENMGWVGILVNGCIRDIDERLGEKHASVDIGGMMIQEGEWLYADSDGILISKSRVIRLTATMAHGNLAYPLFVLLLC